MTYAFAGDATNEKHKWFLTIFGGPSAQPDLENTFIFNMRFEDDTYIAVAYGRDYRDVAPLKGHVDSHGINKLKVSVDMTVLND